MRLVRLFRAGELCCWEELCGEAGFQCADGTPLGWELQRGSDPSVAPPRGSRRMLGAARGRKVHRSRETRP